MLVLEVRTVQECVHERAVLPDAIIDPPFELPEAFPENGVGIIGGGPARAGPAAGTALQ